MHLFGPHLSVTIVKTDPLLARNLGGRTAGRGIDERYCELIARRLDQVGLPFGR
jgi:hypothetical protein